MTTVANGSGGLDKSVLFHAFFRGQWAAQAASLARKGRMVLGQRCKVLLRTAFERV